MMSTDGNNVNSHYKSIRVNKTQANMFYYTLVMLMPNLKCSLKNKNLERQPGEN